MYAWLWFCFRGCDQDAFILRGVWLWFVRLVCVFMFIDAFVYLVSGCVVGCRLLLVYIYCLKVPVVLLY